MAQRYLNKQQKQDFFALASYTEFAERYLPHLKSKKGSQYVKTAKTYVEKAMVEIMRDLDEDQRAALLKYAENLTIDVRFKSEKVSGTVAQAIDEDVIFDLVEHCIEGSCKLCRFKGDMVQLCNVRKIFLKLQIEGANLNAKEGECPYAQ